MVPSVIIAGLIATVIVAQVVVRGIVGSSMVTAVVPSPIVAELIATAIVEHVMIGGVIDPVVAIGMGCPAIDSAETAERASLAGGSECEDNRAERSRRTERT